MLPTYSSTSHSRSLSAATVVRARYINKHIFSPRSPVISALTRTSGPLGLSAFLPPQERQVADLSAKLPGTVDAQDTIPHLPLVARYQDGDFSLRSVMGAAGERNVRAWVERVLQRYRYVVGDTPAKFEMLIRKEQVEYMLNDIDSAGDVALICINDDVEKGQEAGVAPLFSAWQERRWPTPAEWEMQ